MSENVLNKKHQHWKIKHIAIALVTLIVSIWIWLLLKKHLGRGSSLSGLSLLLSGLITLGAFYLFRPIKQQLIRLINDQLDASEYSSHLLTKADNELSILQRIQKSKVEEVIKSNKVIFPIPWKAIFISLGALGISFIVIFFSSDKQVIQNLETENLLQKEQLEKIAETSTNDTLKINSALATIYPPAYTQLKNYTTKNLSLNIPEQSKVNWRFGLSGVADKSKLIFEDSRVEKLNVNSSYTDSFSNPSFYKYLFGKEGQTDITSDYFPLKIIEDQAPKVELSGVPEYQRLAYKENHIIEFKISSSDEYGLTNMLVSATLAKGSGESVKFREKQTQLEDFNQGVKTYSGKYSFSTKELEMEPGDELYFYVAAKDNCPFENHWSKSTTHFVVLEDTTQVTFVDAGGMQLDMMPDFFRSQRQIIIDTEQLMAEKDTLSKEAFNERSNELGYDQKLLRLKYGQFLGEEAESGLDFDNEANIGNEEAEGEHDPNHDHSTHQDDNSTLNEARSLIEQFMHDHDHEDEEGQLLETKGTEKVEQAKNPEWVKEMSHSHDNTEEATFFDVSIKAKLRAALSEMWDSELHLRLFNPEKSLPYQYKSLAFLDEVKNHARAYVQRIGFEPPVIKEQEKRLTGELKEVYSTRDILKPEMAKSLEYLKSAFPVLLALQQKTKSTLSDDEVSLLQRAGRELASIAILNSEYLPVLSSLRALATNRTGITDNDMILLIEAFQKIIPSDKKEAVASRYFRHPINKKVINEFKKTR